MTTTTTTTHHHPYTLEGQLDIESSSPGVRAKAKTRPSSWKSTIRTSIRKVQVGPGSELRVDGLPGRCRFIEIVENTDNGAIWLTVGHRGKFRSVDPERVTCVFRKTARQKEQETLEARARQKAIEDYEENVRRRARRAVEAEANRVRVATPIEGQLALV